MAFAKTAKPTCSTSCSPLSCVVPMREHSLACCSRVSVILASGRSHGTNALREAATIYKVDTDAIALKVKQEFAAKEKAKTKSEAKGFGNGQE